MVNQKGISQIKNRSKEMKERSRSLSQGQTEPRTSTSTYANITHNQTVSNIGVHEMKNIAEIKTSIICGQCNNATNPRTFQQTAEGLEECLSGDRTSLLDVVRSLILSCRSRC